jgi:hypothetical protein
MGTKAVFQIKGSKYRLACMADGNRENLEYIAYITLKLAESMDLLEAIKAEDPNSVEKVFQAVVDLCPGWLYLVRENEPVPAEVISHSAYWDPVGRRVILWDGLWAGNPKTITLLSSADKVALYEADREAHLHQCAHTD